MAREATATGERDAVNDRSTMTDDDTLPCEFCSAPLHDGTMCTNPRACLDRAEQSTRHRPREQETDHVELLGSSRS